MSQDRSISLTELKYNLLQSSSDRSVCFKLCWRYTVKCTALTKFSWSFKLSLSLKMRVTSFKTILKTYIFCILCEQKKFLSQIKFAVILLTFKLSTCVPKWLNQTGADHHFYTTTETQLFNESEPAATKAQTGGATSKLCYQGEDVRGQTSWLRAATRHKEVKLHHQDITQVMVLKQTGASTQVLTFFYTRTKKHGQDWWGNLKSGAANKNKLSSLLFCYGCSAVWSKVVFEEELWLKSPTSDTSETKHYQNIRLMVQKNDLKK